MDELDGGNERGRRRRKRRAGWEGRKGKEGVWKGDRRRSAMGRKGGSVAEGRRNECKRWSMEEEKECGREGKEK